MPRIFGVFGLILAVIKNGEADPLRPSQDWPDGMAVQSDIAGSCNEFVGPILHD